WLRIMVVHKGDGQFRIGGCQCSFIDAAQVIIVALQTGNIQVMVKYRIKKMHPAFRLGYIILQTRYVIYHPVLPYHKKVTAKGTSHMIQPVVKKIMRNMLYGIQPEAIH